MVAANVLIRNNIDFYTTKNRLPLRKLINKKSVTNALNLNFCLGGSPIIIDALMFLSKEARKELGEKKYLLNK